MSDRRWLPALALVALTINPPAAAQQAGPVPVQAAGTLADLDDIEFLEVFLDLGVTPAQAAAMATDLWSLQAALAGLRGSTERAVREASAALPGLRQAVVRGVDLDDSQSRLAKRLGDLRRAAQRQETALLEVAYQRLLNRLTSAQLALLGDPGTASLTAQAAPPDPTQAAARLQQSYLAYGNLFRQARNTPQPDRFRALAPAEVVRTTVAATGLPAGDPALNPLNRLVFARLQGVYYLKPLEYASLAPGIAWELAVASEQARQMAAGLADRQRRVAVPQIDPARLRRAIAYERGAGVLDELASQPRAGR